MSFPSGPLPVPEVVIVLAAGRSVAAVWVNELGGVTFTIDAGAEYVKTYPAEHAALLTAEAARLRWAGQYVIAPTVLGSGPGWLHTAGLPGRSAVDPRWSDHPETAARAIGSGLRTLHDALPVDECPFGPPSWVLDALPTDRLVVCHGDPCAPNTLMSDVGEFVGHVDLGDLGVADRWADLAIATMSLDWNYPGNYEVALLDAYGVAPDPDRIAFYRRLWDMPESG
ncbi:phosphotransferase [Mycobacterium sp. MAA66]|uniref:phosphotransferase n=1 Tax=Mycobacterium sp. MAA66 TaxID=3156297 RepID=UPI0035198C91